MSTQLAQEVLIVKAASIAKQTDADVVRAHMHGMWAAVAGSWGEHAEYADERGAAVTEALLEESRPQPGEHRGHRRTRPLLRRRPLPRGADVRA
jgi:hypothetical protein